MFDLKENERRKNLNISCSNTRYFVYLYWKKISKTYT